MKIQIKKIYTVSNFISFIRILLAIPIFIFVSKINSIEGARYYLLSLYTFAYLTDIADGYFARKFNEITELGKIIDPLADKILVILVVLYLYYYEIIPAIYFWIIILRDIIIFTGGIFVSKKIGVVLPSNYLGKITVLSIGFFIIIVTLGVDKNNLFYMVFYYGSLLLSFASVISYGLRGIKELKKVNNETL
ncbi:MAG: CDP-alcohol phosphatidyltransferase family protein [Ignavibacteriales bacterium]|nr:CDP-alcohol phosphatidyltransferase family protein [Ignavibacteriales bacterium]MCB9209869.1 CDP-alcohol phosphatidyltransferase family protein [Ignavibacteriales bacterium]MCB9260303.1 CDP-alcohol phosphatidyltransferase family protein [Ignavibacteriales bacterium]